MSRGQLGLIRKLYYKETLSVPEIAKGLGVSLDAVYYFMRANNLARRNYSEFNRVMFDKKKPSFKPKTNLNAKNKQLKIAGIMLYWAEGFQTDYADMVDFANSKPEMISLFLNFLRKICGVAESKIRIYLYCYANQDIKELINFWSKMLRLPPKSFTKPYVRNDFDKSKIGKMKYGLVHIRYHDKKLLNLLRKWINDYIDSAGSPVGSGGRL